MTLPDGYYIMVFAAVGPRDGLGVELYTSTNREVLAEIFRDDLDGTITATFFRAEVIPFDVLEHLVGRARFEFSSSVDSTPKST